MNAHLDFVESRHGVLFGHGNLLRRAAEMKRVTGMTQLGIRFVSSSNKDDYEAARSAGSEFLSVRNVRRLGVEGVLARSPDGARYHCTVNVDGFDPAIAPGTDTPSHSGFLYNAVLELL